MPGLVYIGPIKLKTSKGEVTNISFSLSAQTLSSSQFEAQKDA